MKTQLEKTKGKAIWTLSGEFEKTRLTITAAGTARLTDHNGGWGGAYEARNHKADAPKLLSLDEAAALLETWGVDDEELASVRALSPYAAAIL